jgi:hypothetical protein
VDEVMDFESSAEVEEEDMDTTSVLDVLVSAVVVVAVVVAVVDWKLDR